MMAQKSTFQLATVQIGRVPKVDLQRIFLSRWLNHVFVKLKINCSAGEGVMKNSCHKEVDKLRLKFQVQHLKPRGHRMLRWTDEVSTSAVRNVA